VRARIPKARAEPSLTVDRIRDCTDGSGNAAPSGALTAPGRTTLTTPRRMHPVRQHRRQPQLRRVMRADRDVSNITFTLKHLQTETVSVEFITSDLHVQPVGGS